MSQLKKMINPIAWVPSAYFAMGLPFVIVNMVTVLMYKDLGIDEKTITFWTGLILLPWSLKLFGVRSWNSTAPRNSTWYLRKSLQEPASGS